MQVTYLIRPVTKYEVIRYESTRDNVSISTICVADSAEEAKQISENYEAMAGGAADPTGKREPKGVSLKSVHDDLQRIKQALVVVGGCWSSTARDRIRSILKV